MNTIAKAMSVALLAAPLAMASGAFSLGGHASVAYSAFWDESSDAGDADGPGFNVGLAGYLAFNPMIGFNPEFTFAYRYEGIEITTTSEYTKTKVDLSVSQINIDIPLLFRINVMQQGLFFEAGPFVSFDLDADSKAKVSASSSTYSGSETYKNDIDQNIFEFGLIGGAGYSITDKIDVDLRFALGLTKLYDEENSGMKSFMFHLGGTYWFM